MIRFFRWTALAAALAALFAALWAAEPGETPARAPVPLAHPIQDKNFYLLSMIERRGEARRAVETDPALLKLARAGHEAMEKALASCAAELGCYTRALMINDGQTAEAGAALRRICHSGGALERLAAGPLRQSGMFQRCSGMSDEDLLVHAWEDAAHGIDGIIEVYGNGGKPRYPAIDSIAYDVSAPRFRELVRSVLAVAGDDHSGDNLFFQPSLSFAMHLLEANWRDEAGRLEPLEKGENAAALERIGSIEWTRFPYTAILVPGAGNERPGVALSAMGRLRVELAARRYREGKAPLIIVSGGFVHPAQTPYAEAIEMKEALTRDFGISPAAILVDPHARHTTTNMRNAARELYRYGAPFDRAALVTTDPDQSAYIEGAPFAKRCKDELGYVPYKIGKRLSPFDVEWLPQIDSLQADARDPLDP
jgi:hypothetical protein